MGMTIKEETAQLILDAIAWTDRDWMDQHDYNYTDTDIIELAREDFIRFCKDRGIDGVQKEMKIG